MAAQRKRSPTKSKTKVSEFTILPWGEEGDEEQLYVERSDGEGGTFPARDIQKVLKAKEPVKALRAYYAENF
jgi:hypothetical protein